ncbi:MAG TPA: hypothetical protein VMV92_44010 [Streptosporangiaceae bacterium]|nr:hypothetical protein [Streptosporangiaceae bacterium]
MPYQTHLAMLRDAFHKAAARGLIGMKVPGGRALVAPSMPRGYELWPEAEFIARTGDVHEAACKRAGISGRSDHVTFFSNDTVARSPIAPPWAIYPLPPAICAALIADQASFFVTISGESVTDALHAAGLTARWLVPHDLRELDASQEIVRVHNGRRVTVMRFSELARLTLELVDLPLWATAVRELLDREDVTGRPWHHFAHEDRIWA